MSEYPKMTIAELKAELGQRTLEKTGNKAALVARLIADDKSKEAPKEEEKKVEKIGDTESASIFEAAEDEPVEKEEEEDEEEEEKEEKEEKAKVQEAVEVEDVEMKEEEPAAASPKEEVAEEETADPEEEDEEEEMIVKDEVAGDEDEKKEDETEEGKKEDSKKKGPKKWVAIMENEKTDKILDELQKIKKLDSLRMRSKEIFQGHEKHKVRIFPIVIADMAHPTIQEAIKACVNSHCRFHGPCDDPKGMLEITFQRRSILDEFIPKLTDFKDEAQVLVDQTEHEWKSEMRKAVEKQESYGDIEKLRLFAPSLPQTISEGDLWNYFPNAKEIILIDATPRKHAYLTFPSEEAMKEAVENLNLRGPQQDDFKFCRLLRLSNVLSLLGQRRARPLGPRSNMPRSRVRPNQRFSRVGPTGGIKRPARPESSASGDKDNKDGKERDSKSKDTPRRPTNVNRKREDTRRGPPRRTDDRRSSYWRAAPARRRSGGLESSFSQLQQPAQPMAQAQQGLQVLDTLLSTLSQMGNQQPGQQMQAPRRNDYRGRNDSYNGPKRIHSPATSNRGSNVNKRRRQQAPPRNRDYDDRRQGSSYGGSSSYGGTSSYGSTGYGGSSIDNSSMSMGGTGGGYGGRNDNYSSGGSYGGGSRQQEQGGNKLYSALDAVNKIARLRDQLTTRPDSYGGSGGYRQSGYSNY